MNEVKPNVEEILNRLSDVLDVLKRITEDLQDISKSLKTMIPVSSVPTSPQPSASTFHRHLHQNRLFQKLLEERELKT